MTPPLHTLACVSPFESLCVLIITAMVSIPAAVRGLKKSEIPDAAAVDHKPADPRFLIWCILYALIVSLLFSFVLGIGLLVGAWNFY